MRNDSLKRFWTVLVLTMIVIVLGFYLSITNGAFNISVMDVFKTLLRLDSVADHELVVFEFRLPRILLGALVGFALGVAGSVIQGVTRNGLADPGILGINAGAGMSVVLFMLLFQGKLNTTGWLAVMTMPMFGLAGGVLATALVYMFARYNGRLDPQRFILAGIAIASGFGAVTMYVSLKMNPQDYEMAAVWLAGSIYSANWKLIVMMLPWIVIITPIIWLRGHILDVFQLDEASVDSLGVSTEREKKLLLLGCIGLVSASVSVSGSIAFIGLIAPHIAKRLIGLKHRRIIPISGLIGSAMVIVGDFIGKTIFAPAELAVGIVISIIGVPYFVYLLMRSKR